MLHIKIKKKMEKKLKVKKEYKGDIIPIRIHKDNMWLIEKIATDAKEAGLKRNDFLNEILVNRFS
jgi:hypothetical protein